MVSPRKRQLCPGPRVPWGRGSRPRAQQRSGCAHHLSSLWANPLGRGEIARPATSSSSFPLPVVTVTSALLGVRLRLGGINFVQVSIFPDAGQPEELSLLVPFQRRLRGREVRGRGRVDKAPLQPASRAEWEWGREELGGGGEREGGCPARGCHNGFGCWSLAQALGPDLPEHAGSAWREAVYFPGPKPFRLRPCSRPRAARITPTGSRSERVGKPRAIHDLSNGLSP